MTNESERLSQIKILVTGKLDNAVTNGYPFSRFEDINGLIDDEVISQAQGDYIGRTVLKMVREVDSEKPEVVEKFYKPVKGGLVFVLVSEGSGTQATLFQDGSDDLMPWVGLDDFSVEEYNDRVSSANIRKTRDVDGFSDADVDFAKRKAGRSL